MTSRSCPGNACHDTKPRITIFLITLISHETRCMSARKKVSITIACMSRKRITHHKCMPWLQVTMVSLVCQVIHALRMHANDFKSWCHVRNNDCMKIVSSHDVMSWITIACHISCHWRPRMCGIWRCTWKGEEAQRRPWERWPWSAGSHWGATHAPAPCPMTWHSTMTSGWHCSWRWIDWTRMNCHPSSSYQMLSVSSSLTSCHSWLRCHPSWTM